jgi:hypothetical protein
MVLYTKRSVQTADEKFFDIAGKADWKTSSGQGAPSDDEKFDTAWAAIINHYSIGGRITLWDDDTQLKENVKTAAKYYMAQHNLGFDGLIPQKGFGMQPINVRDVSGETTAAIAAENRDLANPLTNWEIAWGTVGMRVWLGGLTATGCKGGAAASDAWATRIGLTPRDAQNDEWMPVWWGIGDWLDSKVADFVRVELDKEVKGDISLENMKAMDDKPVIDTGQLWVYAPGYQFCAGLYINDVGAAPVSAHYLVGVTFGTSQRVRQPATTALGPPTTGLRQCPLRIA